MRLAPVVQKGYRERPMLLSRDRPPDDLRYVRSVTEGGFVIGAERHTGSLLVGARGVDPWPCDFARDPPEWARDALLSLEGELLIVGTGARLHFLPHPLHLSLLERFAGVEVMTTVAACRTYDVLAMEGRRVVAAFARLEPHSGLHGG